MGLDLMIAPGVCHGNFELDSQETLNQAKKMVKRGEFVFLNADDEPHTPYEQHTDSLNFCLLS